MAISDDKPFEKMTRKELIELVERERDAWQKRLQELEDEAGKVYEGMQEELRSRYQKFDEDVDALHQNINEQLQSKPQELDQQIETFNQRINAEWQNKYQELESQSQNLYQNINEERAGWQNKHQELQNQTEELYQKMETERTEWSTKHQELEQKSEQIQENVTSEWETWKNKYEELEERIESLLPGAAAAGLASDFEKSKEKSGKSGQFFLNAFIVSIVLLFALYTFLFFWTYDEGLAGFIVKLPVGFPIIWLAWLFQRSISQSKKLEEMYNHKVNIMALYQGFFKAIPSEAEGDQSSGRTNLTTGTIKEILVNPAELINDFKTPMETLVSRNNPIKPDKSVNKDENP